MCHGKFSDELEFVWTFEVVTCRSNMRKVVSIETFLGKLYFKFIE